MVGKVQRKKALRTRQRSRSKQMAKRYYFLVQQFGLIKKGLETLVA